MTRVAALDRPPVDLAVLAASSVLGLALGAAATAGWLAHALTHRKEKP